MANTDKNIIISPNVGNTTDDPKIIFSGADATTGAQNITIKAYPTNNGTLVIEGSTGQLFSVTNSLSGTIYSVNDISGIPSIEVLDTGAVKLAQYGGQVTANCITVGKGSGINNCNSTSTALGYQALQNNTTGNGNTSVGYQSLYCNTIGCYNIAIGYCSGFTNTTGTNNITIGCQAVAPTATSVNSITIGTASYTCQRAPSATWTALSDCRDKTCVLPLKAGLDFVRQVKPVKFNWKIRNTDETHPRWLMPDSGFIAQDLINLLNDYSTSQGYDAKSYLKLARDEVVDELVADPGRLIPILINAIQELANENDMIKSRISVLEDRLNSLI